MILASITSPDCDLLCFSLIHRNFPCGSSHYRRISGKFLQCISRIFCLTLSRYSRRQISLPSSWHTSACWLYHDGKPYLILFLDERLQMEARYPLLRRHQPRFRRTHSDIKSSQIMFRSHSTLRSPHTTLPFRPNSTFHHLDAGSSLVESSWSWNFRESRGDGKIRGGGKYSNHHHYRYHRPEHPWPTLHSENAREALSPWRTLHCRSGGRKRAGVGGGRRAMSEVAGGQEIWLPIHSIAPRISNQFPRSIANHKEPEILRCRFGTKYFPWFLSDDRRAPLTSIGSALVIFGYLDLALLYLNERSLTAGEIYYYLRRRKPSRYANISTRFRYFVANGIAIDRIRLTYIRQRSCCSISSL